MQAREIQREVAFHMLHPPEGQNSVMQLNMGEGKSSVIVPLIATALADGEHLVRVVVLKALSAQMFQLLVDRLSGLTNRRLFYLPFSRSIDFENVDVQDVRDLYELCMRECGILVAQPEHILSLKLMTVHGLLEEPPSHSPDSESDSEESNPEGSFAEDLRACQEWLDTHSRDILDESDEILHVRYQLIYTMGHQQSMEDAPNRWKVPQRIFSLVRRRIRDVKDQFPDEVEFFEHANYAGHFPHIRILGSSAGKLLLEKIVEDVISGEVWNINTSLLTADARNATRVFLTHDDLEQQTTETLERWFRASGAWNTLLLLRGLFTHGLLVYVFKERRYRVDYGLDKGRSMLAVPFRAKDVPSQRAEFGHPDVAVLLTCLSYYYEGLEPDQVALCLENLFKLDNPSWEYAIWIKECEGIPESLTNIKGINLQDKEQHIKQLVPLFGHNQAVIDFYLSTVVFPKAAKEFPHKLTSSGLDLAEVKNHVTTGFSGTNDNQFLLPASISQQDPAQQGGTNAKVLTYLLRRENSRYVCACGEGGESLGVKDFLQLMVDRDSSIRVLLDVGAQMLDLQNKELVAAWLELDTSAEAGIYFNARDELTVMTRDGTIEPFISSSYRQQLAKCLVYLDDAHTRGTDLKLPYDYRAAVTLGTRVTKDRLVQGELIVPLFVTLWTKRSQVACECGSLATDSRLCSLLHWRLIGL
jgi:hypothetical protein